MPELPDVEVFKRYLQSTSLHKDIEDVKICTKNLVEGLSSSELIKTLKGDRFESAARHGKYLLAKTVRGKHLVLHFGMTGFLKYFKEEADQPSHTRLLIRFSNGYHLAYDCQRKLGEIGLADSMKTLVKEKSLGPDALDQEFDQTRFNKIFAKTSAAVKSALMNRKYIAGIGNIYSDEILFQARMYPGMTSKRLDGEDLDGVYSQMHQVLYTAIEAGADPRRFPSSFIIPHRRTDMICPRCNGEIRKEKIGGRSAYYCPRCQKDRSPD